MSTATTVTYGRVTESAKKEIEALCRNRLNWSDGGHWIGGAGNGPDCFQRESGTSEITTVYSFSTNQAADKWNSEHEKAIRYTGHVGTALITTVVTLATSGLATGVTVGTGVAIVKDELQAKIAYPRAYRGGRISISFLVKADWSPHPFLKNGISITRSIIATDEKGGHTFNRKTVEHYSLDELPSGTISALLSRGKVVHRIAY